jgi:hypothetical protein
MKYIFKELHWHFWRTLFSKLRYGVGDFQMFLYYQYSILMLALPVKGIIDTDSEV